MSTAREKWECDCQRLKEEIQEAFEEMEQAELRAEEAKDKWEALTQELKDIQLKEPDEYQAWKDNNL